MASGRAPLTPRDSPRNALGEKRPLASTDCVILTTVRSDDNFSQAQNSALFEPGTFPIDFCVIILSSKVFKFQNEYLCVLHSCKCSAQLCNRATHAARSKLQIDGFAGVSAHAEWPCRACKRVKAVMGLWREALHHLPSRTLDRTTRWLRTSRNTLQGQERTTVQLHGRDVWIERPAPARPMSRTARHTRPHLVSAEARSRSRQRRQRRRTSLAAIGSGQPIQTSHAWRIPPRPAALCPIGPPGTFPVARQRTSRLRFPVGGLPGNGTPIPRAIDSLSP